MKIQHTNEQQRTVESVPQGNLKDRVRLQEIENDYVILDPTKETFPFYK